VIGGIIEHKHNFLMLRDATHDVFDELNEVLAVFALVGLMQNFASAPVVRPKEMHKLGCARGRNQLALTPFHPAAMKEWV
jgi:hypothetical protein